MRSGSFDNLTLSSLVVSQGHYAIRCFLKKTYKHRIKSGLPVYNDYQISDDLAFEIKSFIEQTKALRAQLPKPYLLVYQGDGRRIDTHLAPMVLTGRALSFYLCSVLEKEGVRDDDGIIGRESLRSIRAEMGRMLFAKGKTAKEVSAYLGNSPEVAAKSYNQCYPIDEARKYNDFYKETLERTALLSNSVATKEQSRLVMFGTCLSYKGCNGKVIAIPIDCISYPQENTFAISVPTEKETPYHIPVFHKYNFLINGMCESIYYKMLIQQRDYAASMQEKLSTPYKGYLFVHPSLPRLITTADFNKFLSKICTENHVIDSEGNPAVITSHDLRHINVCERLQGNTISAFDTMVECNHSSLTQTLGYGYPSKKDSTDHLADITKQLPLLKDDKEIECLKMPQFKYSKLLEDSGTKVIPGYGICRNLECEPQFEKCLQCESFSPDPQCREYFLSAIDFLRKRNEKIIKKNGDQAVVQRNAQSIQLYQNCINKMDAASASRKGSAS